jgi:hypothetical protein
MGRKGKIMSDKISVVSVDDHYLIHEAIRSLLADCNDIELVGEGSAGEGGVDEEEPSYPGPQAGFGCGCGAKGE